MVAMLQPPSPAGWRKSSRSGGQACAEVSRVHDHVWVRNSRSRGLVLGFPRDAWAVFIVGLQRDEFEPAS
jgi:hypothetical protein